MKTLVRLTFISALLFASACSNETDPEAEKNSFTRFYDNNLFNTEYTPLDAVQTPDGGYLILASRKLSTSNLSGAHIMKTDAKGNFVSGKDVDETLVGPAPALLNVNGRFFFFCMTPVGLQTQLVEVSADGKVGDPVNVGRSYPSAAAVDGSNMILLNYDNGNRESVISLISVTGSTLKTKSFTIGAGADVVDEAIQNHFLRTGKQLPFQVGKSANGLYYFNGIYNYTMTLVFTDFSAKDPVGTVSGYQTDGGITKAIPTSGGKFAAARFNFGNNYFLPSVNLQTNGASSTDNLEGNYFPELEPNSPVVIMNLKVNGKDQLIYGSNTKGNQIGIFGYDPSNGSFNGSRYLGYSNAFQIASMTATSDDGLLICGTTYLAGRFPRICLFKLSAEDLADSFH